MWHNPYVRTGQFRRGRLWARVAVWRLREGWARLPIGVRFLWLLLGVMLGLMTPLLGVGYLFLQHSLEMHQQLVQRQRLEAVVRALERELAALLRQVQDYTVWDDAHTAISRRDAPWIQRNITEWLPQQFHYDFAVVVDAQGAVVGQAEREWAWLRQTAPFQRARRGVSSAGLHRRGETIYLIAAAPIVDEQWRRPPAGALVVGRALDATLLQRISQSAGHTGGVGVQAVRNFSNADYQFALRETPGQSAREDSDPLLKVPPASRGNQAVRGTVPLAKRDGEPSPDAVPLAKRGGEPSPDAVPLAKRGEPQGADKGTTAWHGISAAGAVFPSASVNRQARCIALTPFVPLSREAGEGERAAGRTAARSYTPLPQRGRGAGGEGKKWAPPAHSEPKRCTLIRPQGGGQFMNSDHAIGIASSVSHLLHDSAGRPIALLTVEPPRAEQAWLLDALCLAKQYLLVFGGALALIASLTMVLLLQSQLRRFSVAIQRLTSGDWDARVAYPARDEFGYLARAFNQMAQQLQQAFEAQEQQREELLAQNEELERMHAQLQQAHQELATLNAELLEANRALAQAAVTDGLTGLKNHRAFQEALHSAVQMAERLQQPLSLVMFDIDHFKQFNDTFGHPAGDELLRQVAQVLRESARAYDVAARYGGEEFALLLPNTTLEQAVQVAERLRQQIRAIENPHAPVSASFGVATYRRGTPPATLVYEADAALYRAKRSGRDQVCVYQPEAA
jgi:diguanylate cyclase (GGDEF)-like protein